MKGEDFPDQLQIELIRERLWSGREFGRASVMIGAGFSKNAQGSSPTLSPFPSWGELASVMYQALYPPNRSDSKSWEEVEKTTTSGIGAMGLSSEYEALFGRAALDDLISRSIPDERFEPGPLHSRLLSLPWSDVFTTNYDTLLERARTHPEVYERKYELVLTPADLPLRAKPRIVKLHGSLPSHRPFVITDEDYRTYPDRFAPFVNTVQQSVMENALCLLGFSGEDPNFLRWIGWVRDNLGASVPPIYLCGLLGLSRSRRELFDRRNVVPIDLSPLFPTSEWPDTGQRHAKAIEWFLRILDEGEPPQVDGWPEPGRKKARRWSADLPGVPPSPGPVLESGPIQPTQLRPDLQEIRQLHSTWRASRLKYPGWIVLPERNRKSLWRKTEHWIEPVLELAPQLDAPGNLLLLHELNWRLERCLVPLFEPWTDKIIERLGAYNPYPKSLRLEDATFTPENAEGSDLDWGPITEAWVELAFAVARVSREDQKEQRYRLWMERLETLARRRPDWRARFSYERCLFSLGRLDQDGVETALEYWPSAEGLSFWDIRRAAVLAEMGELQKARQIANDALSEIRRRLEPFSSDRALLSQEGLAVMFLESAELSDLSLEEEEFFRLATPTLWAAALGQGCNRHVQQWSWQNLLLEHDHSPELA
jgi:SIR2-like domain